MQVHLQALKSQEQREIKVFQKKISKSSEEKEERKSRRNTREEKKNLLSNILS